MKIQSLLFYTLLVLCFKVDAQNNYYSVANAHSHNDYQNKFPFTTAYNEKFGSMEADIFLWHDSLIVGHTRNDIVYKRTLEALYLDPLQKKVNENHGYPYKDSTLSLQLLIDLKTNATETLDKLVSTLYRYNTLIHSTKVKFVITGNRPAPSSFHLYPSFILFDGDLKGDYTNDALKKIALLSDDLKNYTRWNGKEAIAKNDKRTLDSFVQKAHVLKKKIRFWDSPDFPNAWRQLIDAGVDYINTDHIPELAAYLAGLKQKGKMQAP